MEILGQNIDVLSIAFVALTVGLLTQLLVKPAMDAWGPDTSEEQGQKKRAVIINGVSILLGWLMAWLASILASQALSEPASWADVFFRGLFGTGFAVLGYEGVSNLWAWQQSRKE